MMINRRMFVIAAACFAASPARAESWQDRLVAAAESQIGRTIRYDPAYVKIAYPGGDVPIELGVCTDVIIRAYRDGLGLDLQKLVHEDMARNFAAYPGIWGLSRPDRNIDHRRVPNLQAFFKQKGAALPVPDTVSGFAPGDLVTMMLPGNLPHIVIVSAQMNDAGTRLLAVHNIGGGARREDVLSSYRITGRYRFAGT